jgi:hypothetical protein
MISTTSSLSSLDHGNPGEGCRRAAGTRAIAGLLNEAAARGVNLTSHRAFAHGQRSQPHAVDASALLVDAARRSCGARDPLHGFVGGRLSGDLLCRRRRAFGGGDIAMAVSAIRHGALDFIEKPFRGSEIVGRLDPTRKPAASSESARAPLRTIAPMS